MLVGVAQQRRFILAALFRQSSTEIANYRGTY